MYIFMVHWLMVAVFMIMLLGIFKMLDDLANRLKVLEEKFVFVPRPTRSIDTDLYDPPHIIPL